MRAGLLRAQLETALGERASSPFTDVESRVWECVPSGIPALDASIGGLPRGAIIEIFGAPSSGKTTLALSILAARIQNGEVCALVDGMDSFDPESGAAAGIDMRRLLWVRCRNLDQVLRSTDLLLQGGGFGAIAVDMSDLPPQAIRNVPLAAWFRLQRVLENTSTVLLTLGRESAAKSAAAVVLRTNLRNVAWSGQRVGGPESRKEVTAAQRAKVAYRNVPEGGPDAKKAAPSHGRLLSETQLDVDVVRLRHVASLCRRTINKVHHDVRMHAYS